MKISVIETRYVGFVTGTCFAETDNNVIFVDIVSMKSINTLTAKLLSMIPVWRSYFLRNLKEGRMKFIINLDEGIKNGQKSFSWPHLHLRVLMAMPIWNMC